MAMCKVGNTHCHAPYWLLCLVRIAFFFLNFPFAASLTYNYSTFNQQTQNSSYPENQTHNLYINFFFPSISNYGSNGMNFFLSPTDFAFTDQVDSALCLVTQKETALPTTHAPVEIVIDDFPQVKSKGKLRLIAGTSMGMLFLFIVFVCLSLWFWRNNKVDKDKDQGVLNTLLNRGEQDEGLPDLDMPMNRLEKEDEAEVDSYKSMDNDDGVDLYSMDADGTSLDKSIENVAADLRKSMDDEGFDEYKSMDEDFMKSNGSQKFSFKDLADATNDFSEKIGEGGFGAVCKGFLEELNCFVVVKRVSRDSRQGMKEFASEVKIIGQLRHRNILQLIGWCHEKKELLLVYEFMSNGSLDYHLFKETSLLTWEVRYKIAIGLASGLHYLQEELEQYVVHRDIKASNVMLDSNFNPKLGDFGLARVAEHGRGPNETPLAGTPGYVAPEYSVTHKASKESDIYSFGIVGLEIAKNHRPQGKRRSDKFEGVGVDLYGKRKLLEAADPTLNGDLDKQELECLMIVGLWCAHPDVKARPTIEKAIHVLNFVVPLPDLPSSMPLVKDFSQFSMSSVGTDMVHSTNSFSEEGKLGFDKWKRSNGCRMFCYEELVIATENFSEQNKLKGHFDKKEMEVLMVVGLWCTHPDPKFRIPNRIESTTYCYIYVYICFRSGINKR